MSIGLLTSTASRILATGTQVAGKISIPNSSRMINAGSMSWLNKAGNSIGKHIIASIESGKLLELVSLGANMFGVPAILDGGSTHHPVVRFEPGPDNELNLASVFMLDSAGKPNHWKSSPNAAAAPSPPWSSMQTNSASSSLPQRPPAGLGLSLIGVALNNLQKTQGTDKPSSVFPGSLLSGAAAHTTNRRPSREEYEAKINARQTRPAASTANGISQTNNNPNLNVQKDATQRFAESINSMREHQDEMQRAQAFLSTEPEVPYSKPRLSRQEFEDRLNGKR
ncbi:type III effector [Pseudomonas asuensis]|uniref:type III effector n=1 Tax=Pseudomonas asuensis TaxID=1825787 RepID=UPI001E60656D|nr:type III effector [Pseudomonas asuensis]